MNIVALSRAHKHKVLPTICGRRPDVQRGSDRQVFRLGAFWLPNESWMLNPIRYGISGVNRGIDILSKNP
jgi:hypothetical protein